MIAIILVILDNIRKEEVISCKFKGARGFEGPVVEGGPGRALVRGIEIKVQYILALTETFFETKEKGSLIGKFEDG